jgi:hypothetical protein
MSRRPAQEPILGDKRTCDALDLIIVPRLRIWVAVFPCTARCRTLRSPRCPQGSPQINCVSQVLFAIGGERHISDRIAPAVRAIEQADVAFQLFYDDDPSANGEWPSGGAQTVSLDRLQETRRTRRRRDRCAFVFEMRDADGQSEYPPY